MEQNCASVDARVQQLVSVTPVICLIGVLILRSV